MLKVIKHETIRFFRIWIFTIILYLIFTLMTVKLNTELMAISENLQVGYFISVVNLFILMNIILDNFTSRRLLYYHSNLSHFQIFMGKLGTVFIYTFLTILITTTLYNIRLYILLKIDYLTFFRMNLDNAGFALMKKSLRECFYPFNFLLNLTFIDILIYAMGILFHRLRKNLNFGLSLIISVFSVAIPNVIIFRLLNLIEWTNIVNYNIINKRIHVMILKENEINFLNIVFVIVCVTISIFLIDKICKYQKENRL